MAQKSQRRVVFADIAESSPRRACSRLLLACTLRNLSAASLALSQGANVNCSGTDSMTPLHIAAEHDDPKLIQLLCDQPNVNIELKTMHGLTALHTAALVGNTEAIEKLLWNGAFVNCQDSLGRSPLHYAVFKKDTRAARVLIKYRADVNVYDRFRECPLYNCVMMKPCLPMVRLLLYHGASATGSPDRHSLGLLIEVILSMRTDSNLNMVKILVRYGADVNGADPIGLRTPLHVVAMTGNERLTAYLLRRGGDPLATNLAGQTPIDVAIACRNSRVLRLLRRSLLQDPALIPTQSTTSLLSIFPLSL